MINSDKERILDLEQENWERRLEIKEMEDMLEGLDSAYTDAVNLLYDCKCAFRRMRNGEVKRKKTCKKMIRLIEQLERREA